MYHISRINLNHKVTTEGFHKKKHLNIEILIEYVGLFF